MSFTIAILGRPNVGKSTLFNRLVGRQMALVDDLPGVTRDRREGEGHIADLAFRLIDTAGLEEAPPETLAGRIRAQTERSVDLADVALLVIDAREGVTPGDHHFARWLRGTGKPVILVANKAESRVAQGDLGEAYAMGLGDPVAISARHGEGLGELYERLLPFAAEREEGDAPAPAEGQPEKPLQLAIVGRPNVGKSTLVNRLVGEDRVLTGPEPGITRDAIAVEWAWHGRKVRLVDTAGMRRRARSGEGPEYYSLVRALRALDRADVALLVLDASEGVTHQDQRLAERIDASGSPVVILLNKWDVLDTEGRLEVSEAVADRLAFLGYAPVLRVSAMTGLGVHRLLPAVQEAMNAYHRRIPTGRLNDGLRSAQSAHPAPGGARILYGVQGAVDPPTITLFATRRLPPTYLRYLERSLRERFELGPTPIDLRVRVRQQR